MTHRNSKPGTGEAKSETGATRRDFLKQASAAAVGGGLLGSLAPHAHAAGQDTLKVALVGCGGQDEGGDPVVTAGMDTNDCAWVGEGAPRVAADLAARLDAYAPTELAPDLGHLTATQRQVLDKLVEAARIMHALFQVQATPCHDLPCTPCPATSFCAVVGRTKPEENPFTHDTVGPSLASRAPHSDLGPSPSHPTHSSASQRINWPSTHRPAPLCVHRTFVADPPRAAAGQLRQATSPHHQSLERFLHVPRTHMSAAQPRNTAVVASPAATSVAAG